MLKRNLARPSAVVLIIASIFARLLPHPPNMTPIGATALFGGSKLGRPWNYIAPLFILFLTDLFLGLHGTIPFVYGSFLVTVWLGERFLKDDSGLLKVGSFGAVSAVVFFVISNFGVWVEGYLYPKTFAGLLQSYVMALPFLRNMLIGDVIFSVGIFALYAAAERRSIPAKVDKTFLSWLVKT